MDDPYIQIIVKQRIPESYEVLTPSMRARLFLDSKLQRNLSGFYAFVEEKTLYEHLEDHLWLYDRPTKVFILDPLDGPNLMAYAMLDERFQDNREYKEFYGVGFIVRDLGNLSKEEHFSIGVKTDARTGCPAFFFKPYELPETNWGQVEKDLEELVRKLNRTP